ncbi:MAG: NUDIX domain-containing protein, partial [Candidatus Poribacteria bacterium]
LHCDGLRLRIGGVVTRDVAHFKGVPHGALQVAIIIPKRVKNKLIPHLLLHWRDKRKKTCPETWDICGGHIDATNEILSNFSIWDNQEFIEKLFRETALREANEEFSIPSKPEFKFKEQHLKCFGGLGVFESGFDNPKSTNKEYSAFFIAFVPKEILTLEERNDIEEILQVKDSVGVGGKEQEKKAAKLKVITLPDLIIDFDRRRNDYADGIGRILSRVIDEPGTLKELTEILDSYFLRNIAP